MTLNNMTKKVTTRKKKMNETRTRKLSESILLMRDCVQPFLDEDEDDWYDDEENNLTVEDILNLEDVQYAPSPAVRTSKPRAPRTTAIVSPSRSIPNSRTRYEVKISPGLRLLEQHQRRRNSRRGSATSDEGDEMDFDEEEDEEEGFPSFCMFEMEL